MQKLARDSQIEIMGGSRTGTQNKKVWHLPTYTPFEGPVQTPFQLDFHPFLHRDCASASDRSCLHKRLHSHWRAEFAEHKLRRTCSVVPRSTKSAELCLCAYQFPIICAHAVSSRHANSKARTKSNADLCDHRYLVDGQLSGKSQAICDSTPWSNL